MSLKYELRIYNTDGTLIKIFSSHEWLSLKYDRIVNDVGTLACVFGSNQVDWLTDHLLLPDALDYFLEVYRLNENTGKRQKEDTYFLRLANPFEDETGAFFAIGGLSLDHLLMRRVIDPNDDSRAAGGYVTDTGTASDVIEALIEQHLGVNASSARQVPNFSATTDSTGNNGGGRWRYDSLFKVIQELATIGSIQFKVSRVEGNTLVCNVGTLIEDKTATTYYTTGEYVLMNKKRGNLFNPSFLLDYQDEQNYVYARGSGSNDNETVLELAGSSINASPYNRIEFSKQIRKDDGGDSLYLLTGAVDALNKTLPKIEFTTDIQNFRGVRYRVDWDVGDLITARWGGYTTDLQVKSVEVNVEDDQETVSISVESYR